MKTIQISSDGTVPLPSSLFKPKEKVAFIREGDTVILKKIISSSLGEIAARGKGRPLSLKEVVKEIHLYRKEKRAK